MGFIVWGCSEPRTHWHPSPRRGRSHAEFPRRKQPALQGLVFQENSSEKGRKQFSLLTESHCACPGARDSEPEPAGVRGLGAGVGGVGEGPSPGRRLPARTAAWLGLGVRHAQTPPGCCVSSCGPRVLTSIIQVTAASSVTALNEIMLLTECQKPVVTPGPSPEQLGREGQATTREHVQRGRPKGTPGSHTPFPQRPTWWLWSQQDGSCRKAPRCGSRSRDLPPPPPHLGCRGLQVGQQPPLRRGALSAVTHRERPVGDGLRVTAGTFRQPGRYRASCPIPTLGTSTPSIR